MAEVHTLSAKTKARLDAEAEDLDAMTLLRTSKGAIKPCEHNAFVLIAQAPRYAALHFDEFLSRLRFGDRDWIDADRLLAAIRAWCRALYAWTRAQRRAQRRLHKAARLTARVCRRTASLGRDATYRSRLRGRLGRA